MNIKVSQLSKYPLALLLLFSALVHVIVISHIHLKSEQKKEQEKVFEVELIPPAVKRPPPKKKTVSIPIKKRPQKKKSVAKVNRKGRSQASKKPITPPPIKAKVIKKVVKPILKPTLGGISQPTIRQRIQNNSFAIKGSQRVNEFDSISKDLSLPNHSLNSTGTQAGNSAEKLASQAVKVDLRPSFIDKSDTRPSLAQADLKQEGRGESTKELAFEGSGMIRGEVANRKVLAKPKAPLLDIEKDVTVILSFTVLPNGSVDQITPFRKSDPTVERIAIRLLRDYRFAPLLSGNQTQRGRIHFVLKRK